MKPTFVLRPTFLWLALSSALFAAPGDLDNDGLRDEVETNTGVYVSPADTGTNPAIADTDGDSLPDGMELNLGTVPTNTASKVKRPNIIFIMADDLAYGDIGCFWQNQRTGTMKFSTPNLDAMAAEGVKMTHHYAGGSICAPSRASFFLGQHQGNALIRDVEFDRPLPDNHNVASILKKAGYRTVHIGKAGLAGQNINSLLPSDTLPAHPLKRGFDRFFGYLSHDDGHEHYPRNGTTATTSVIHDDYRPVTDAYVDLHTTDVFTAFAKKTIIEETQSNPDRPFFIHLAYDTPHFNGCTSPTRIYPAGRGLGGGIQWQGAPAYVNTAVNDPARINNIANADPSVLSSWSVPAKHYVSMIRRLDDSVADLLQTLRDLGIDDDTLVVFTSDNGSSDKENGAAVFQSSAGFEGAKFDIWEGGIRVPTIAWWPQNIIGTNNLSNIRDVALPSAGYDWMATFAELARTSAPAVSDGVSLVPTLTGSGVQREHEFLFFDQLYGGFTSRYPDFPNHGGESRGQMQAIRMGDLMGVRNDIRTSTQPFRIYNVVTDTKQAMDLAALHPDIQAEMQRIALGARRKGNGLWGRLYDGSKIPAALPDRVRAGIGWSAYEGFWQHLPDYRGLTPVAGGRAATPSAALLSRTDDAGLAFNGFISLPTDGQYTFQLESDAATCLWLHEGLAIDNDAIFSPVRASAPAHLAAGLHPIRIHYRHSTGTANLVLKYSGPGIPLQPVPASAFFVEGSPPELLADAFTVKRNIPQLADLLANDISEGPLTLLSGGTSFLGSSTVVSNQLRFEPSTDRLGVADFSYFATDGFGQAVGQARATVLFDNERWIPFEEGSGTTVRSVGDNPAAVGSFAGIADPAAAWRTGRFGKGLQFDGIDDQVNFPGMTLPTGAADRTFSCWVKTSSRSSPEIQTIFSYGSNLLGGRFKVRLQNTPNIDSDQPVKLDVFGGFAQGTTAINDGQWHHLAIVVADHNGNGSVNVNEAKIYVDGVPDVVALKSGEIIATGSSLVPALGGSNHNAGFNFQGSVDDLRIFPRALGDAEVAALHAAEPWYLGPPPEPTDDSDGDGMTDVAEEVAGTDPGDPASVLKILGMTRDAGSITLAWEGVPGRQYHPEQSDNLAAWLPVPGADPVSLPPPAPPSAITSPLLEVTFPKGGATKRFYRIRVTAAP